MNNAHRPSSQSKLGNVASYAVPTALTIYLWAVYLPVFQPNHSSMGAGLLVAWTVLAFSTTIAIRGWHKRSRELQLERDFEQLEGLLMLLCDAELPPAKKTPFGIIDMRTYRAWKTAYVQRFGKVTIVSEAKKGNLPGLSDDNPKRGNVLWAVREFNKAAQAA